MINSNQISKQMLDFNKMAFEKSFSAMVVMQDQAEKMFSMCKRLINHIFTASQNYVKEFSKRFEEEFDDTMAGEQG